MKKITVFTPTYNRCDTLGLLYRSLVTQSDQNFCWLIVDDGSGDDTRQFVDKWIKEEKIEIKYIYQQNKGKMQAHNLGVSLVTTELFVCVDSDDWLAKDAIKIINRKWDEIDLEERKRVAGFIAYGGINENTVIGNKFPNKVVKESLSGLYEMGFYGDTTLIFRTKVISAFPFLQIKNEKFITEAYVYNQIDQIYQYILLPEILTICEYRNDGYTNNGMKLVLENPGGWAVYYTQLGNLSKSRRSAFKRYVWANSYEMMFGYSITTYVKPKYSWIFVLAKPLGYLLFLRRKIKYDE